MVFYESESKSEAIRKAIQDTEWSETEKKALADILTFVEVEEANAATIATEEWQNNPVELPQKPGNVFHGKWVNGQDTYASGQQKYMVEDAGSGYRIGKCYPEAD